MGCLFAKKYYLLIPFPLQRSLSVFWRALKINGNYLRAFMINRQESLTKSKSDSLYAKNHNESLSIAFSGLMYFGGSLHAEVVVLYPNLIYILNTSTHYWGNIANVKRSDSKRYCNGVHVSRASCCEALLGFVSNVRQWIKNKGNWFLVLINFLLFFMWFVCILN